MKNLSKNMKILYLVEASLLVLALLSGIIFRFDKTFDASELIYFSGDYNGEYGYIDTSDGVSIFAYTNQLKLHHGMYKVTFDYETDGVNSLAYLSTPDVMNSVKDTNNLFYTNTVKLLTDRKSMSTEAFINYGRNDYIAAIYYMGNGYIKLNSIRVQRAVGATIRTFLETLVVILIVNCCVAFAKKKKEGLISKDRIQSFFIVAAGVIFASLPLFLNYLIEGHDLTFHLLRIEGIKESLLMGVFPDKIQPNWLSGNGYAVSVFYGDILLYIPALLRLCGFTVWESYNIFVFLSNVATSVVAYICFDRMIKNKRIAAFVATLYTLSLYRLIDIYIRSSVGEYQALIFLPILIYGIYKIFTEDIKAPEYKKNWILPSIAFTGIINTHILTCEVSGAFTILVCLIFFKKTFRKETLVVLVKTVVVALLINLFFFVPFVDFMTHGTYVVTSTTLFDGGIQQFGAQLGQLLVPFASESGHSNKLVSGMANEMPATMGFSLLLCILMFVYAVMSGMCNEKKNRVTGWICVAFAVFSLIASTYFFPWDTFMNMNKLFKTVVISIQFPWRFLSTASVFAAVCGIYGIKYFYDKDKSNAKMVVVIIGLICFVQSGMLLANIMNTAEPFIAYSPSYIDSNDVIGGEYLPTGSERITFSERYYIGSSNLTVKELERKNNDFTIHVECDEIGGIIQTSLVYYRGYKAYDVATGANIEIREFDEHGLGLIIPENYNGDIRVKYNGFWYWNVSYLISLMTVILVILVQTGAIDKIKNAKKKEAYNE